MNQAEVRDACRRAREAALAAWAAIAPYYRTAMTVHQKADGPVTEADRLADKLIVEHLLRDYPRERFGYLSEEFENDASRLDRDAVWIIDPIDGTGDFIRGQDDFAVQIGLAARSSDGAFRPVAAVVYCPRPGQMFTAQANQGTWLEEESSDASGKAWWDVPEPSLGLARFGEPRRLAVSTTTGIGNLVAVVSKSHSTRRLRAALEQLALARFYHRGSVGVKVSEVAMRHADFYLNTEGGKIKEWDAAAPQLILEEAGGRVTDLRGDPFTYNRPDVRMGLGMLASNGVAHEELLEKLAEIGVLFE